MTATDLHRVCTTWFGSDNRPDIGQDIQRRALCRNSRQRVSVEAGSDRFWKVRGLIN